MPLSPRPARCAAHGLESTFLRRVAEAAAAVGVEVSEGPGDGGAPLLLVAGDAASETLATRGQRAVVVCVPHRDSASAARSLAAGAEDVVSPRTPPEEVAARLAAAARRRQERIAHQLRDAMETRDVRLVGRSAAIQRVRRILEHVAPAEAPVRIDGEAGTGKRLVARLLHSLSPRRAAPLLEIDAGTPDAATRLLGSGRAEDAPGALVAGRGATLLVRGVERLDSAAQLALARWVRTRRIPLGPSAGETSDARLLVISHEPLDALAAKGLVRSDLALALAAVAVRVPPLRERTGDAALLLAHFLEQARLPAPELDADAHRLLDAHRWPGNVAELNAVAMLLGMRGAPRRIGLDELLPLLAFPRPVPGGGGAAAMRLDDVLLTHVVRALAAHGGVRARAAKALGISPRTLYNHLRRRVSGPGAGTTP